MDCMLFTFENRVLQMRLGASEEWHISLPLMNSFNKTEAAVFTCSLCFMGHFILILINQVFYLTNLYKTCVVSLLNTYMYMNSESPCWQALVLTYLISS